MPTQVGFTVDGTPRELSAAYPDGLYIAQNVGSATVYYVSNATADTADGVLWYIV